MELVGPNALLDVDGNTIVTSGTGLSVSGFSGTVTQIANTTFTDVDTDINDRFNAAADDVTWNLGATGNSAGAGYFGFLAGRGDDIITGTAGKDAILTNPGDDAAHGQGGDDSIFVNAGTGTDIVDGGSETERGHPDRVQRRAGGAARAMRSIRATSAIPATTIGGLGKRHGGHVHDDRRRPTRSLRPTATNCDARHFDHDGDQRRVAGRRSAPSRRIEIEDVRFNLGSNGDTVNISGRLQRHEVCPDRPSRSRAA